MNKKLKIYKKKSLLLISIFSGCIGQFPAQHTIPAEDYAAQVRGSYNLPAQVSLPRASGGTEASVHYANATAQNGIPELPSQYERPLPYGDPGVSSSLWRESSNGADFFKDNRAWKSMDLITIIISENAEGKKEADTDTKSESSILLAIQNILGLEVFGEDKIRELETDNLLQGSTKSEFKGEGETTRKDTLKATISAMVAEVLPSGVLRVEGRKIISVNNEEQTMVISGLVRPRDIDSLNQIESHRIANMRIDYFGQGVISEKQKAGWLSRIVDKVAPF